MGVFRKSKMSPQLNTRESKWLITGFCFTDEFELPNTPLKSSSKTPA